MYKYNSARRRRRLREKNKKRNGIFYLVTGILITQSLTQLIKPYEFTVQSPVVIEKSTVPEDAPQGAFVETVEAKEIHYEDLWAVDLVEEVEPTPTPKPENHIIGLASYYSREGCIGCNENLIMANGEELDDSKLTLALSPAVVNSHKLINDYVTVENLETGYWVKAKVTDTGGFTNHSRIADLSVATKEAIKCSDICNVKIVFN
jgi:hypothetical protein